MNADIFLGIDMGSTGLKAVAFEAGTGATLAASGGALPYTHLPGGGCELSADAIESALMLALRSVAEQLGPRVADIRALSCTGHGAGLYALDEQGRLLAGRAVASTDQRAAARARTVAQRWGDALYQEVGCRPWAGQSSLIAAELFDVHGGEHRKIRQLLFAKDYLTFLLSGQAATDASDVSTAGLLSLDSGAWSAMAFEAAGLSDLMARALPPIVPAGTVIGRLLPARAAACGLPAGLPIAVGAIDLLASLAAVGAVKTGHAVAVFGTWCVNAVVAPAREPKPDVGAIVRFGPASQRLYLENSPSSMANVAWLARTIPFADAAAVDTAAINKAAINKAAVGAAAVVDCAMSAPLGAEGLRFLPFINGGGVAAGATAGFVGLKGHHGRAHMARAVIDAVVALHAWHLKRLAARGLGVPAGVGAGDGAEVGTAVGAAVGAAAGAGIAALGGGARDPRMVQLLANFLGHPVQRCGDDETGARGAAGYAALSQGACADDVLPVRCVTVEPETAALQAHAEYFAGFEALIGSMAPAFEQLARPAA